MKNQKISNGVLKGMLRQSLYQFAISAVTNYYKSDGLNPTQVYYFTTLKSNTGLTGLKSRYQLGYIPFWRLPGKNSFLVFSIFWSPPTFLGLQPLHLQSQQGRPVPSHITELSPTSITSTLLSLIFSSFSFSFIFNDYLSPQEIIQENCLI